MSDILSLPIIPIVITSAQTTTQLAAAQIEAEWRGNELAIDTLAGGVIEKLLTQNVVPKFTQMILDMINQRDELQQYTTAQLKNIIQHQLPRNSIELINETLEFIATQANILRTQAKKRIDGGLQQSTPATVAQMNLLDTNALALMDMKDLVTDVSKVYTTPSILHQLSAVFTNGWTQMRLTHEWRQQVKFKHKEPPAPRTQTPKKTPRQTPAKPKPRKQPKPVKQPKQTTVKVEPSLKGVPMWDRKQKNQHIGSRYGKITGTEIPTIKGNCNNWQIWSDCVPQNSSNGCTWKHVCNTCGDATHGAHDCPYNKEE